MNIRTITEEDWPALLEMSSLLWPELEEHELEAGITEVLQNDYETGFIALDDRDKAIGFAYASVRRDYVEGSSSRGTGYLEAVFAREPHRRKGVAQELVRNVEEWCTSCGCGEIGSDTDIANTASQGFHKGIGYKVAGTNVHFIKALTSTH